DWLRPIAAGLLSARCYLRKEGPRRGKADRSSGRAADADRVVDQHADREGSRGYHSRYVARARGPGDRVALLFAAAHSVAFGTKRTCQHVCGLSALRGKADKAT